VTGGLPWAAGVGLSLGAAGERGGGGNQTDEEGEPVRPRRLEVRIVSGECWGEHPFLLAILCVAQITCQHFHDLNNVSIFLKSVTEAREGRRHTQSVGGMLAASRGEAAAVGGVPMRKWVPVFRGDVRFSVQG